LLDLQKDIIVDVLFPTICISNSVDMDSLITIARLACACRTLCKLTRIRSVLESLRIESLLVRISASPEIWKRGAESFVSRVAQAGNAQAQYYLGMVLLYTNEDENGVQLITKAALSGHNAARFSLQNVFWKIDKSPPADNRERATLQLIEKALARLPRQTMRETRALERANLSCVNDFLVHWNQVQCTTGNARRHRRGVRVSSICGQPECGRRGIVLSSTCQLKVQMCSRCLSMQYCSKACQRQHWKNHQKSCSPWWTHVHQDKD